MVETVHTTEVNAESIVQVVATAKEDKADIVFFQKIRSAIKPRSWDPSQSFLGRGGAWKGQGECFFKHSKYLS